MTKFDIRCVTNNLINRYYGKVNDATLNAVVERVNRVGLINVSAPTLLPILKEFIETESNRTAKMLYADCYVYVEYISGISIERVLQSKSPVMLCSRRCLDTCASYCEGYDTTCENYISDDELPNGYIGVCSRFENDEYAEAIEVCSFEEGDPQ
jgi:hypothetical protein